MGLGGRWGHEMTIMKRAKTPRGGEPWTIEENASLIMKYRGGMQPEDLAVAHGRTAAACVSRLCYLNVLVSHEGAYYELPKDPYVTVRRMMNIAKGEQNDGR